MWKRIKIFASRHGIALVMCILMPAVVFYTQSRQNYGYEFSKDKRIRVDVHSAYTSWQSLSKMYKNKTGSELDNKSLDQRLRNSNYVSVENEVSVNSMLANPDRVLFRKYTFDGIIASKIRIVNSNVDYALIKTESGTIRVYYFSDLPYQDIGSPVTVTGIVLGRPYDKEGDIVSFISEADYTKSSKKYTPHIAP